MKKKMTIHRLPSQRLLLAACISTLLMTPTMASADDYDELRAFSGLASPAPVSTPAPVAKPTPVARMTAPFAPAAPLASAPVRTVAAAPATVAREEPRQAPAPVYASVPEIVVRPSVAATPAEKPLFRFSPPAQPEVKALAPEKSAVKPVTEPPAQAVARAVPTNIPDFQAADSVASPAVARSASNFQSAQDSRSAVQMPLRPANAASETQLRQMFASAVRTAVMISPQMRSAQAQSEAAQATIGEAKGQRWPQVDVSAASPNAQFGGGERNRQSGLPTLGVSVATNLYDFGQTSRTIESREEQYVAAEQATQAQEEEIAWQVSNTLIELHKQELIVSISMQYVARMNQLTTMLSGIVQADAGRRSELTQARGRLLQAEGLLSNAESKVKDAQISLQRLIGKTQDDLPSATRWNFAFGSLSQQLQSIERHPSILKATAEARAALKEAEAIKASGLPKLNWVVSKNTAEDSNGRQQSWQTGLNVSWGLFRGGSTNASERAAIFRAESSRQLVQEQVREFENRVRAADQDAHSMQSRAMLYSNLTVESDRIRHDFFDQWYHLGRRTLLDVLSAETDYYNNQVSEVTNQLDSYAAIFRGYASAGTLVNWLMTGNAGTASSAQKS